MKKALETGMLPCIQNLVDQWNRIGIIYEGQAGISSWQIEHNETEIYEILREHGGNTYDSIAGTACEVKNQGWMYALFTFDMWDNFNDVHSAIKNFFK